MFDWCRSQKYRLYVGIVKIHKSRPSDVFKIHPLNQERERQRVSVDPISIEIVQYNARIINATRYNFECIHWLGLLKTFLITHPYYYFVLLSVFVSVSVSLLFWSHTQILKYLSIWGVLSAAVAAAGTACHKYFSSYGPSGFHTHTHIPTVTPTDTCEERRNSGGIWKNNQK